MMERSGAWFRSMPTLGDRYRPDDNSFGAIRLVLAICVLVSHAWPLGFAAASPGYWLTGTQGDLGLLSVQGFFVVSGFLVTASAMHATTLRYLANRALRVLPGLWLCMLLTVAVFGPVAALYGAGSLRDYWSHPDGPVPYVMTNWLASMERYPISGLLADTPFGRMMGGPSAFNGSLWSLHYEFAGYLAVAALAVTAVLHRARRVLLLIAALAYVFILRDLVTAPDWTTRPPIRGAIGPIPVFGSFAWNQTLYLGFIFVLGAAAYLYRDRLPMSGRLAAGALATMVATALLGGYWAFGVPAYVYLLLYLVVAAPRAVNRIGRRRDYSYGIYLYAFPVQQLVALVGGNRYGVPVYLALTGAGTFLLAALSWHLVEHPALRLKRRRDPLAVPPEPAGREPATTSRGARDTQHEQRQDRAAVHHDQDEQDQCAGDREQDPVDGGEHPGEVGQHGRRPGDVDLPARAGRR